jgi:hypothetical protein
MIIPQPKPDEEEDDGGSIGAEGGEGSPDGLLIEVTVIS